MLVQRLILKNWRNFQHVDIALREVTYVVGANAAGKSNLLDVFRFLRDICKPQGGGLLKAVEDRGGISKLRCLHARRETDVRIEVHLAASADLPEPEWKYSLAFKPDGKSAHRILITEEVVWKRGVEKAILQRPGDDDEKDPDRKTQTHIEQIQTNSEFRDIAKFFADVRYLHVVPQLLKFGDQIGGQRLENDPFGQNLLEQIAASSEKSRNTRLKRIEVGLQKAIPQFKELRFIRDQVSGRPHLEVRYEHHRPRAGWQREDQWSDGTLRIFGLLWSLLDTHALLLIEEPELSLNNEIVRQIPLILDRLQRDGKRRRQIILTTHSDALLSNEGIEPKAVLRVMPSAEGSIVEAPDEDEMRQLAAGFSPAEVILQKTKPVNAGQLRLF